MEKQRKYCVIGTPIGHSKSPQLYRAIFDEKGLYGYTYVINEIQTESALESFIMELREGLWDGCNVTMPWKTNVAEYMDELLPNAALTKAVNTVVRSGSRLIGDSTDGGGMCDAIEKDLEVSAADKDVVILGCGGAARSIIAELALRGARRIRIFGRQGKNWELTEELKARILAHLDSAGTTTVEHKDPEISRCRTVESHAGSGGSRHTLLELCDNGDSGLLAQAVGEADILINCTPLGMVPHEDELPLPKDIALPQGLIIADSVYNPDETLLIKKAKDAGCRTVKGIRMLEEQAVRAAGLYLA